MITIYTFNKRETVRQKHLNIILDPCPVVRRMYVVRITNFIFKIKFYGQCIFLTNQNFCIESLLNRLATPRLAQS